MNRSIHTNRPMLAVFGLAVLGLVATACGVGNPGAATTTTQAFGDPAAQVVYPEPVHVSVCFDGSPSVDAASRAAAIKSIAALVASWATASPAGASDASPAVAGLDLRIRKVMGGNVPTGSAGAEVVHVQIPSLPRVIAIPAPGAANWDQDDQVHQAQRTAANAAAAQAADAAQQGATAIRNADYTATSSEVLGCLEAAARADEHALVILVSDLNQQDDNGRPLALSGQVSLSGRRILLVEACGARGVCGEHAPAWQRLLKGAHAEVQVGAPESMSTDLPAFLGQRS